MLCGFEQPPATSYQFDPQQNQSNQFLAAACTPRPGQCRLAGVWVGSAARDGAVGAASSRGPLLLVPIRS